MEGRATGKAGKTSEGQISDTAETLIPDNEPFHKGCAESSQRPINLSGIRVYIRSFPVAYPLITQKTKLQNRRQEK